MEICFSIPIDPITIKTKKDIKNSGSTLKLFILYITYGLVYA
jgi:hypothetical protein